MTQQSFLPVVCQQTQPPPSTVTAEFVGLDESTMEKWLCKGKREHPLVPVTEWVCSHLAKACGLPVPDVAVVVRASTPDETFFGSKWQGGARDVVEVFDEEGKPGVINPGVFAKTHAVDLFVHNTDRHLGNYLYLELYGQIVAKVIDFSHSFCVPAWPMPDLPMDADCNTSFCWSNFFKGRCNPYVKPVDVLETISKLPDNWLSDTLSRVPPDWIPQDLATALGQWWASDERAARAEAAKRALT